MSEFNKDDYLNDLPDADELAGQGAPAADAAKPADSQAAADQPAAPKPEGGSRRCRQRRPAGCRRGHADTAGQGEEGSS